MTDSVQNLDATVNPSVSTTTLTSPDSNSGCTEGDPPISGGFPPPPHPKEEFPSPPSSAQYGGEDLADMETDLAAEGDNFTLSRLLGAEPSPNPSWDCLSLGNSATPPATSQASLDAPSGLDTPPTSQTGIETPPEVSIGGREFESSEEKVNTLGYETPPNIPHSYENLTKSLPTFTSAPVLSEGKVATTFTHTEKLESTLTHSSQNKTQSDTLVINSPIGSSGYRPWEAEQNQQQQFLPTEGQERVPRLSDSYNNQGIVNGQAKSTSSMQVGQQSAANFANGGMQHVQGLTRNQSQGQGLGPVQGHGQGGQVQNLGHGQLQNQVSGPITSLPISQTPLSTDQRLHHNDITRHKFSSSNISNNEQQQGSASAPSQRCEFEYTDLVPPPNTQAPPSHPIPPTSRSTVTHMTGRYTVVHGAIPSTIHGQQPSVSAVVPHPQPNSQQQFQHIEMSTFMNGTSPNKFPQGRVFAKARRQSSQSHSNVNVMSPSGPFSPSNHQEVLRPASSLSLTEGGSSTTSSTHPPTPTPLSPQHQPQPHFTLLTEARGKVCRGTSLEGSESDRSQRSDSADTPTLGGVAGGAGAVTDCGQVAAISSTDPTPETLTGLTEVFKPPTDINLSSPNVVGGMGGGGGGGQNGEPNTMPADTQEKPAKKKRKRCGECVGCARKDNCGECAPCRNNKSHQICKMRRCEALTEKKVKPRKSAAAPSTSNTTGTSTVGSATGRTPQKSSAATPAVSEPSPAGNTATHTPGGIWQPPTQPSTVTSDPWTPNATAPTIGASTLQPSIQQPTISVTLPTTTLTFDTAYNFSGPSIAHNSVLNEFMPQDGYRNLGRPSIASASPYLDHSTASYHLTPNYHPIAQHPVAPATNNLGVSIGSAAPYIQGAPQPNFIAQRHHASINQNHRITAGGFSGMPSPHNHLTAPSPHHNSLQSPHNTVPSPHHPLPSPHHPLPSPHHPLPSPHHPLPSPHHQPLPSPHHPTLPSPHHQPLPSPHHPMQSPRTQPHSGPIPSPRPYANPTPSPSHNLTSPAHSKHGTPLPSPAPPSQINDEYQVTSSRSPGASLRSQPGSLQDRSQQTHLLQQQQGTGGEDVPVYTVLPPTSILPTDTHQYASTTQKYSSLYNQDSFLQLNFQ